MSRVRETLAEFRSLPFAQLDEITGGANLMILAPHPDDESLGCGGLIAEACKVAQPPVVVILTDGTGSHPSSHSYPPERLRALREKEARCAVRILGLPVTQLHFLRLRDTATPTCGPKFDAAVTSIVSLICTNDCRIICAPWAYEPHSDHAAAHIIARAAALVSGAAVFSYLVWGWLLQQEIELPDEAVAGWRLNIDAHIKIKRRAISAHVSQCTDLINDDPNAFRLPTDLLSAVLDNPYEVLLRSNES